MHCTRHIQNSGIFKTLFIQVCLGIFKHIHTYQGIVRSYSDLFRYIQGYSSIFTHTEALLRHAQTDSGIFSTLRNACMWRNRAYSECWNIQNFSINAS